jgi:hypothetical protein
MGALTKLTVGAIVESFAQVIHLCNSGKELFIA